MEPLVTIRNKTTGEIKQVPQSQVAGYISQTRGSTPNLGLPSGLTQSQFQPQAPTQPQGGGLMHTLGPLLGSIGGGLLGIPLGPAGIIGGGALGGAAGSALTGGSGGDILKEGLLGGVGGLFPAGKIGRIAGVGARAAEEAGAQTAERGGLAGLGSAIRKSVVNPQVGKGVKSGVEENLLTKQVGDLGITGSAQAQRIKSAELYNQLNSKIGDILDQSKQAQGLSKVSSSLIDDISTKGQYFIPGDATYEGLLQRELTNLSKKAVNGRLTAKALFDYKIELGGQLRNAFRKENGDLNSALTVPEQVRLDVWRNIDNLITTLEPGVKDLTMQQSILHQAAPGLAAESKKAIKLPFTGIPIPGAARVGQAGADLLGRGLETTGKLPPGIGSTVAGQVGSRLLGGMGQPQEEQSTNLPLEGQGIESGGNVGTGEQTPQDILRQRMGAFILSRAKNANDLMTGYNLLYPKTSQQDPFLKKATDNIDSILQQKNLGYGPIGGNASSLAIGKLGGAGVSPEIIALNQRYQLLKLNILRAYQGARISDADFKLATLYTPTISDTATTAKTKLQILRQILQKTPDMTDLRQPSSIPPPASYEGLTQ